MNSKTLKSLLGGPGHRPRLSDRSKTAPVVCASGSSFSTDASTHAEATSAKTRAAARGLHAAPRRFAVGVAAVTALVAGLAAPASADQFGQGNSTSGRIPDNFGHRYCFDGQGWTSNWRSIVNGRMQNLDAQTSYYDGLLSACDDLADIRFRLDSSIDARGLYRCNRLNTGDDGQAGTGDEECEQAVIWLNPTALTDNHQRAKTACHEIGHSVGLAHGSTTTYWNDCMRSGTVPAGDQWERYNAHHVNHANSRVPTTS